MSSEPSQHPVTSELGGGATRLTHFILWIGAALIRRTVDDDTDDILALATASGLFDREQAAMLADMLRSRGVDDVWFTDELDGKPVGAAYLAPERMTNGTWNLYWIAVLPRCQRQGRGRAILNYVETWLKEQGERVLLVETSGTDDFEYVRAFYASNGFVEAARLGDFYDDGVDKIIYRKSLASGPRAQAK